MVAVDIRFGRLSEVRKPVVRVKCFCGEWITVGEDDQGDPCLAHELPPCPRYLQPEPMQDFLRALRQHYEGEALPTNGDTND